MKQFNLDEYLKNPSKKIVTRDGREAEVIGTCAASDYPVTASVKSTFFKDKISYQCTKEGRYYKDILSELDLFFALEKHEGWVNIYEAGSDRSSGTHIWLTKEDAKKDGNKWVGYVTTVKIEWEE